MSSKNAILLGGVVSMILGGALAYYLFGWDPLVGVILSGFLVLGLTVIVGEFLLWYKTRKEYKRYLEGSALIGRHHF